MYARDAVSWYARILVFVYGVVQLLFISLLLALNIGSSIIPDKRTRKVAFLHFTM